jgi:signal transduction histidine kinase/ActR/RegA family two-component response regulator
VNGPRGSSLAIAIFAPVGRDAALASDLLARAGLESKACKTFADLETEITRGTGAVLMTEEELTGPRIAWLSDWSRAQSPWSDLPIIVFSSLPGEARLRTLGQLQDAGNVSFVDRPVQRRTFLAAIRSAVRARERQYESRRAIEARDQFLAMLGHELRNPLSAVRFATDLIARQDVPDPWVAKHAATIERQTAHLNRLVDDLLDVSRVTSGKVILRKERTDLALLTARALESLHGMSIAHGVALTRRPEVGPVYVDGDAVRLEQVVCNLVTNAIKYTPRGGHVEVSVSGRSGAAVLIVRDDGIGVPPDQLQSIFEVFSQAPTGLDRTKGGLGLGLALVRALVNMHGGAVEAYSQGIGQGSTFTVTLPLLVAAGREAPTPIGTATAHDAGTRIVLVEDNVDIRETLAELLVLDGYQVEGAGDGPQGLTRILARTPEVALIDVGLPGYDGYELAKRVRAELGEALVLIAMTGYGQPDDRARAFDAGFDEHVVKPVSLEDLASAIERTRRKKSDRSAPLVERDRQDLDQGVVVLDPAGDLVGDAEGEPPQGQVQRQRGAAGRVGVAAVGVGRGARE